jgi:3-hydroxyacyl-CoA dehydrogenase
MKLVEVVIALNTSEETVASAEQFAASIGKRPIRTKDRSGFIVNMLLIPYLIAAVRMYEDGFASREDIDEGMRLGCGHPMGPLTLCDFIGLDVLYAVCDSLYEEFKRPEYAPPPLLKRASTRISAINLTLRGLKDTALERRKHPGPETGPLGRITSLRAEHVIAIREPRIGMADIWQHERRPAGCQPTRHWNSGASTGRQRTRASATDWS